MIYIFEFLYMSNLLTYYVLINSKIVYVSYFLYPLASLRHKGLNLRSNNGFCNINFIAHQIPINEYKIYILDEYHKATDVIDIIMNYIYDIRIKDKVFLFYQKNTEI